MSDQAGQPSWQAASSVAELQESFRQMRAGALAWHCVSGWPSAPGVPVLHLVVGDRADVADVPRALTSEGVRARADVGWRFVNFAHESEGVIDVEVITPLRCTFSIAISARQDRALLEQILATQRLGLVTECPAAGGDLPPMVVMSVRTFTVARAALHRVWGEGAPR